MPARAIFLVGFMACGNTISGKELAARLNWDFVDLDAEIESHEGQTIAEIFRLRGEHGENGYRDAETEALHLLTKSLQRDTVIALGGGTFLLCPKSRIIEPLGFGFSGKLLSKNCGAAVRKIQTNVPSAKTILKTSARCMTS